MSISTTSLFLRPVRQAEVDPPVPASSEYTMFLPSGTPLATIARAKLQEGTLGFSWAVDQDLSQPDMAYQHNQTDLERMHPASAAGKPYFSGRLLTANDLGAEQEACVQPGAGAAAPATSSDLHAGTPGETLARSLPASRFDAVALNPQPLPPKDINQLVQWVLRESYTSTTEDLRFYAEKVKVYNDAKKQVRDELHGAREALGDELHDTALSLIRKIGG